MAQIRDPFTGWWRNLPEPRAVTALAGVFYALALVTGLLVVADAPRFLEYGLGALLLWYWTGLLIAGGIVGLWGVAASLYVAERFALLALGTAFALYIVTVFSLQHAVGQNLSWRATLDAGLIVYLLVRWVHVRHGLRNPEKYSTYGRGSRS